MEFIWLPHNELTSSCSQGNHDDGGAEFHDYKNSQSLQERTSHSLFHYKIWVSFLVFRRQKTSDKKQTTDTRRRGRNRENNNCLPCDSWYTFCSIKATPAAVASFSFSGQVNGREQFFPLSREAHLSVFCLKKVETSQSRGVRLTTAWSVDWKTIFLSNNFLIICVSNHVFLLSSTFCISLYLSLSCQNLMATTTQANLSSKRESGEKIWQEGHDNVIRTTREQIDCWQFQVPSQLQCLSQSLFFIVLLFTSRLTDQIQYSMLSLDTKWRSQTKILWIPFCWEKE